MKLLQRSVVFISVLCCFLIFIFLQIVRTVNDETQDVDVNKLLNEISLIEKTVETGERELQQLRHKVAYFLRASRHDYVEPNKAAEVEEITGLWKDPITVLVFVCNRADALRNHINKLLRYRTSAVRFPIVISQDCDNSEVREAVKQFGSQVHYIKHISSETAKMKVPVSHQRYAMYYKISRHYKLGLTHVFEKLNHTSVIITEDDLDISPDFFHYFGATRWLLHKDKSLYCVSAWNDNGKPNLIDFSANNLFYRSDFFSGLGWMMTSELWKEIGKRWPLGFWDDWMREPEQRRTRSCIRPEISRTAMTEYGRQGASKGLFFKKHLKLIALNNVPFNFSTVDLKYLLKEEYDLTFRSHVYSLKAITIEDFIRKSFEPENQRVKAGAEYRIEYHSMTEFTSYAAKLQIMVDTKAGVPRTAYLGVVSCIINGIRIYLAPANITNWGGYDRTWEPPFDPSEIVA